MTRRLLAAACVATLAGTAPALHAASSSPASPAHLPANDGSTFKALLAEKAPAIVSLKFILKGGEQDEESETTGFVIDGAKGLVLTSNNAFGGMAARFGGPTPTPSDIKILIGDDVNGLDATFVARDTELGLAWVKLKDAPATPLAAIDLSKDTKGAVGDEIYTISLMGKFFDRIPAISEGHIGAVTTKPRQLYIPSIGLAGAEQAMPIFNSKGEVLGVSTIILPDQEEMMNPGGMRSIMRGITGGMILPASEAMAATTRALETATQNPEGQAPSDPANAPAAAPATAPAAGEAKKEEQPK